jgi:hypothetical protein
VHSAWSLTCRSVFRCILASMATESGTTNMYRYKTRPARRLHSATAQSHNTHIMARSSTSDDTTSSNAAINSDSQVLTNFRPPTRPILKSAFQVLCVIAVSRPSLEHWENTKKPEWKEHVAVMINRFQNSNVTVRLKRSVFMANAKQLKSRLGWYSQLLPCS